MLLGLMQTVQGKISKQHDFFLGKYLHFKLDTNCTCVNLEYYQMVKRFKVNVRFAFKIALSI